jgi:hypothetical protein
MVRAVGMVLFLTFLGILTECGFWLLLWVARLLGLAS